MCGDDVLHGLGLAEEAVEALLGAGALRAALVLPDDVDLLPGVAAEVVLGELTRAALESEPGVS